MRSCVDFPQESSMPIWKPIFRSEGDSLAGLYVKHGEDISVVDGDFIHASIQRFDNAVQYSGSKKGRATLSLDAIGSFTWTRRFTLALTKFEPELLGDKYGTERAQAGLHISDNNLNISNCWGPMRRFGENLKIAAYRGGGGGLGNTDERLDENGDGILDGDLPALELPDNPSPSRANPWLFRIYQQRNTSPAPVTDEDGRTMVSRAVYYYYSLDGGDNWNYFGRVGYFTLKPQYSGPLTHNSHPYGTYPDGAFPAVEAEYDWFQVDEWGADTDPPELGGQNPAPGAENVALNSGIVLELTDLGAVNADSVIISVDGAPAWLSRTAQPGFSVVEAVIAGGYRYTITPDGLLPRYQLVTVDVYAEDQGEAIPNVLDTSYQFHTEDASIPFIGRIHPEEDTTRNPRRGHLELDLLDAYGSGGVKETSIRVTVDGELAFSGADGTFRSPFDSPESSIDSYGYGGEDGYDGYRIRLQPTEDFGSYRLVIVNALFEDASGQAVDRTYGFRVEDYVEPAPSVQSPPSGALRVDPETPVLVVVDDFESGIDAASLMVHVNGDLAYSDGEFLEPFDDPGSSFEPLDADGYQYRLDLRRRGPFRSAERVDVEVTVDDNEGN